MMDQDEKKPDQKSGDGLPLKAANKKTRDSSSYDSKTKKKRKLIVPVDAAIVIIIFLISTMQGYVYHSTMLASEAYSSPSIILSGRRQDGSRYIIDDYREAYYWLK